jgi:hypothetical protein
MELTALLTNGDDSLLGALLGGWCEWGAVRGMPSCVEA